VGPLIAILVAAVFGAMEGLTEFLQVSSIGHLIPAAAWLDPYHTPAAKAGIVALEIGIPSGAVPAVAGIYVAQIRWVLRGLTEHDTAGRHLMILLPAAFLRARIIGKSAERRLADQVGSMRHWAEEFNDPVSS